MTNRQSESGFSIIELIVATAVLLIVTSIVANALMSMTQAQTTIWNRTEMHSGIRGATELLQQEVGQAGRVSLPSTVTLAVAINPVGGGSPAARTTCDPGNPTAGQETVALNSSDASISSVAGIFATAGTPHAYMLLTTMDGNRQESFVVASKNAGAGTITACFTNQHAAGTVVMPMGSFATGIIPPTGIVNPSTDRVLKMFGDINGDGKMVYVEYTCDHDGTHSLYRNVVAYDSATKPSGITDDKILLNNIITNPGGTPCFTYQTASMLVQGTTFTFVLDVAVTLTVETQQIDPVTKQKQTETKALLNVSPRNVFNAFSLASIGYTDRIQSTPVSVTTLMGLP